MRAKLSRCRIGRVMAPQCSSTAGSVMWRSSLRLYAVARQSFATVPEKCDGSQPEKFAKKKKLTRERCESRGSRAATVIPASERQLLSNTGGELKRARARASRRLYSRNYTLALTIISDKNDKKREQKFTMQPTVGSKFFDAPPRVVAPRAFARDRFFRTINSCDQRADAKIK